MGWTAATARASAVSASCAAAGADALPLLETHSSCHTLTHMCVTYTLSISLSHTLSRTHESVSHTISLAHVD